MAVRRAARTIDSLAEEFASSHGLSKDNAIHIALTEAIARSEEPGINSYKEKSARAVRKVVFRQICLASICANSETRSQMWKELRTTIGGGLFCLTVGFALQAVGVEQFSLEGMVILGVPASVALLYYYSRTLSQRDREEKQRREILAKEIYGLGAVLPENLRFLCDGTADDLDFLVCLQKDEKQEPL
jgi:hypothetical protein